MAFFEKKYQVFYLWYFIFLRQNRKKKKNPRERISGAEIYIEIIQFDAEIQFDIKNIKI